MSVLLASTFSDGEKPAIRDFRFHKIGVIYDIVSRGFDRVIEVEVAAFFESLLNVPGVQRVSTVSPNQLRQELLYRRSVAADLAMNLQCLLKEFVFAFGDFIAVARVPHSELRGSPAIRFR